MEATAQAARTAQGARDARETLTRLSHTIETSDGHIRRRAEFRTLTEEEASLACRQIGGPIPLLEASAELENALREPRAAIGQVRLAGCFLD